VNNKLLHRVNLLLVFIFCLGFCLRFFWVMTLDNNISWEDEADYMTLSEKICAGEGFVREDGTPTAFRAIGYPVFLSLLKFAGFYSPLGIRLVQVYLSILIIWLVYVLGNRIFDKKTGIIAVFITAIYPYYIFMPGTILAATLLTCLILFATLTLHNAIKKSSTFLLVVSGVILGLAILTKPSAMTFVFGVIAWLFIVLSKNSRKRLIYSVLFILTLLLTISPWMMRNYVKMNTFSITTNVGRNLWLGNNPLTTVNTGSNIKMDKFLEQKIDNARTEIQAEKIYFTEVKNFIIKNPGRFILLTLNKGLGFWRWSPSPTTGRYYEHHNYLYWLSVFSVGPVFIFALLGFILTPKELRKYILLWLFYILFFTVLHAFFISKVRFRLPLDIFLILTAAYSVQRLKELVYKCKAELRILFKSNTEFAFKGSEKIMFTHRKAKE